MQHKKGDDVKMSGRSAIFISLVLSLAFMGAVVISGLGFAPAGSVSISAGNAGLSQTLAGRDDPAHPRGELLPGELIDINTASADRLSLLPGIGDALSAAIVAYRQENGAFSCKEDIMKVDGIGNAKFAALQDMISIGEEHENSGGR